jgi:hypothetical protein
MSHLHLGLQKDQNHFSENQQQNHRLVQYRLVRHHRNMPDDQDQGDRGPFPRFQIHHRIMLDDLKKTHTQIKNKYS